MHSAWSEENRRRRSSGWEGPQYQISSESARQRSPPPTVVVHERARERSPHPAIVIHAPPATVPRPDSSEERSAYTSARRSSGTTDRARRRRRRRSAQESYASSRTRSRSPLRHRASYGGDYTIPQDFPPPQSVYIPPAVPATNRPAESIAYSIGNPFSPETPLDSSSTAPTTVHVYSHPLPPPPPPPPQWYAPSQNQQPYSGPAPSPYCDAQQYQVTSSKFGDNVLGVIYTFLTYRLPLFCYQLFLFRMPVFYYGRVSRVLEDAEMSLADVRQLARATASEWKKKDHKEQEKALDELNRMTNWTYTPQYASQVTPAMRRFRESWETFIDSLLREWKTQNVISALLLSCVIDVAASDVVTRTACILALIAALMSLLYGCLYIIRFGTMKRMHKASAWADEAQKRREAILWNVWVLLAMPVVWLTWSIILFIVSIMCYVWRTGSVDAALGTRIGITCMLGLGVIYLAAMANTFSRYGDQMDKAWKRQMSSMVLQMLPDGTTVSVRAQPGTSHSRPTPANQIPQQYPAQSVMQGPGYVAAPQTPYNTAPIIPSHPYSRPEVVYPPSWRTHTEVGRPPVYPYPAGYYGPYIPPSESPPSVPPQRFGPPDSHFPSTTRTSTNTVRSGSSSRPQSLRRPSRRSSLPSVSDDPVIRPGQSASRHRQQQRTSPVSVTSISHAPTNLSEAPTKSRASASGRPNVRLGYPAQAIPDPPSPGPSSLPSLAPVNWPGQVPYLPGPQPAFTPQPPIGIWSSTSPAIPMYFPPPSQAPTVLSYASHRTHSTEPAHSSPARSRSGRRSQPPQVVSSRPLASPVPAAVPVHQYELDRDQAFERPFTRRGPFSGFGPRQIFDLKTNREIEGDNVLFETVFSERDIEYSDFVALRHSVQQAMFAHHHEPWSRSRSQQRGRDRTPRARPEDLVFKELKLWNERFFRQRGMSAVLAYETRLNAEDGYAVYLVDSPNTQLEGEVPLKTMFADSTTLSSAELAMIYLFDSHTPSTFRERRVVDGDVVIFMTDLRIEHGNRRRRSSAITGSPARASPGDAPVEPPSRGRSSNSSSSSSRRGSVRRPRRLSTIEERASRRRSSSSKSPPQPDIPRERSPQAVQAESRCPSQ
ncbi:hypothetical protein BD626DRAFT_508117 [Schizophyllum amplum]|uniref:Uncharacterized protein n=1 Tax=Schizophyllum amplum TaxID=97359 RepID=A0A550C3I5_9AGAR|nr:hypothetical protein BD626DRAFT_508117 [Auriculariopsis ampla]